MKDEILITNSGRTGHGVSFPAYIGTKHYVKDLW
jgi:hypothetical protein